MAHAAHQLEGGYKEGGKSRIIDIILGRMSALVKLRTEMAGSHPNHQAIDFIIVIEDNYC